MLAEDTSEAFKDMAAAYLQQFDLIRVGVTGSVGKTSTRQLTAAVLSEKYKTVCSQKNLNTHLGLCMTAFLADETTQAIVFEMGMDRKGEIAGYVEWARPQAAISKSLMPMGFSFFSFFAFTGLAGCCTGAALCAGAAV